MDRRSISLFILSVLMVAYLAFIIPYSLRKSQATPLSNMEIVVNDPEGIGFVSESDVMRELDSLPARITSVPRCSINTLAIERYLCSLDRIDTAHCVMLNNGVLRLEVRPMTPVARVFDASGESYYVSADSKRIGADVRYHIDVPVVSADFDSIVEVAKVLPVLDYIKNDPVADAMVSGVKVDRRGDIILIPIMRGHVINFGNDNDIANKWKRLKTFYRKVMPVKGWEFYDTVSVKWRGQVVATRRTKPVPEPSLQTQMLTDTLLPEADVLSLDPPADPSDEVAQ